jgi:hypothetical protein
LENLPSETLERRLRFSGRSPTAQFGHFRREIADNLRRIFEIFPFLGDATGDRVRSGLRGGRGDCMWRLAEKTLRKASFLPVVADGRGQVVIGHGRVLAAKKLRMLRIPVVEIGHLSPARLKALRIANNRLAQNAPDSRASGSEI